MGATVKSAAECNKRNATIHGARIQPGALAIPFRRLSRRRNSLSKAGTITSTTRIKAKRKARFRAFLSFSLP